MNTPKNVIRHPASPRTSSRGKRVTVPQSAVDRSRAKPLNNLYGAGTGNPIIQRIFSAPQPPMRLAEDAKSLAQDDGITESFGWAQSAFFSAWEEGMIFPGYAELSLLAVRAEYRIIAETLASEMTREWIEFKSTGDDDKKDKIKELEDAIKSYKCQYILCKFFEQDAFFGRSHIYIDTGDTDNLKELQTDLGSGKNAITKYKMRRGKLKKFKNVEPVWVYPTRYNSNNPLKDDWYKPTTWQVMGTEVHSSRLLTLTSREIPDLLKPAYSFGGLSMTQMVKPYVDNWLRTRQSVADLIHAFSVFVLKTDMGAAVMSEGGQDFFKRLELFNNLRDNRGVLAISQESEDFANVNAPLGTLDQLQAQTQEHVAAIAQIPLVKYTGIQPAGLNASSEGEIRVFYDRIAANQERHARDPLETMINFIQLSLWGEIDPEITFDFKGLWQLDEAGTMAIEKVKADIDTAYLADGVVLPEEVRERAASDKESIYQGLDLDKRPLPPPEMPNLGGELEGGGGGVQEPKLKDPASRMATSLTNKAANFGGAVTGGFDLGLAEDELVSKEEATYTDSSTTPEHCADCTMFIEPNKCKTVEGNINPEGWCKYFAEKRRRVRL